MNSTHRVTYTFAEVLAAMLAAAWEKLRDAYVAYAERRALAAAARDLGYLSDHLLRDIGLHRSQIGAAPRQDRPWW
jgi:uncharacterized protein YjiS (DUF1127 family)